MRPILFVSQRINLSYRWRISSHRYCLIISWIMGAPARPIRQLIGCLILLHWSFNGQRTSSSLKFWPCQVQLRHVSATAESRLAYRKSHREMNTIPPVKIYVSHLSAPRRKHLYIWSSFVRCPPNRIIIIPSRISLPRKRRKQRSYIPRVRILISRNINSLFL